MAGNDSGHGVADFAMMILGSQRGNYFSYFFSFFLPLAAVALAHFVSVRVFERNSGDNNKRQKLSVATKGRVCPDLSV